MQSPRAEDFCQIHPVAEVRIPIGNTYFDSQLARLLHLIGEKGSVQCAGEAMGLSCPDAQTMLDTAQEALGTALLSGGTLSVRGRQLLDAYQRYCQAIQQKADALYSERFLNILE